MDPRTEALWRLLQRRLLAILLIEALFAACALTALTTLPRDNSLGAGLAWGLVGLPSAFALATSAASAILSALGLRSAKLRRLPAAKPLVILLTAQAGALALAWPVLMVYGLVALLGYWPATLGFALAALLILGLVRSTRDIRWAVARLQGLTATWTPA